jgi:hypothetical protein
MSISRLYAAAAKPTIIASLAAFWMAIGIAAPAQNTVFSYVPSITTIAGNGTAGASGDGGLASASLIGEPIAFSMDAAGNLYLFDKGKDVVRRISPGTGGALYIYHVAGVSASAGFTGDGGAASTAKLSGPNDGWVVPAGDIFIADTTNDVIRVVYEGGANAATLIAETNPGVTPVVGDIYDIAGIEGTATAGFAGDGSVSNTTTTKLSGPNAITVDASGNVFIGDSGNQRIREITLATGVINTIAGTGVAGYSGDGGLASAAQISGPRGLYVDPFGTLYITDRTDCAIRKITGLSNPPTAVISHVAGVYNTTCSTTGAYSGDGGPAISATLFLPDQSAVDANDNIYISDSSSDTVRVINAATGIIYTLVGKSGSATSTGNGGLSTLATVDGPANVGLNSNGTIYVSDSLGYEVRQLTLANAFPATSVASTSPAQTNGVVSIQAGTLASFGIGTTSPADFSAGAVSGCALSTPLAADTTCSVPVSFNPTAPGMRTSQLLATDSNGGKYLLGLSGIGNAPAVSVSPGLISSFAGNGTAGSTGDGSAASAATVTAPAAVALDSANDLYLAGSDNKVRMVSAATGKISTIAGTGAAAYTGDGSAATAATFNSPSGLAVDSANNVYIADAGNNVIRKISGQTGIVTTVPFTLGVLSSPRGVAVDASGNLYIADTGNNVIREIMPFTAATSTVAGISGTSGYSGNNVLATTATLNSPAGVAIDSAGNIYIADTGNNVIRKITVSTGIITTVAGNGTAGSTGDGAAATSAELNKPTRVAVDAAGDLFIADYGNNKIRFVSAASGFIFTVAGKGSTATPYTGDGGPATAATLNSPGGITLDQLSNLYIADTNDNRIAFVTGPTTTLAFGALNPGAVSAAQVATVNNFGNQTLTLTGLTIPAGYVQGVSGGNDCSSTTSLAPGASCLISITFAPGASGGYNANIVLTDNALNTVGATQKIALTGSGNTVAPPASIVVTAGNNQTVTPYASLPVTLQATVKDTNGFGVANATVVFTAPSTGATGTFANGTATTTVTSATGGVATATLFTAGGTTGTFTITATTTGVTTPANFSETIAGKPSPAVTVFYAPATNPVTYGQSITPKATLTPSTLGGNSVSGTVAFYDNGGTTAVASGPVSNGAATATTPIIPSAGAHSYTAVYSGDPNFSTSTSATPATLTVNPLGITAAATSISIPYGTSPIPTITGSLSGVLPADASNVTPAFTSTATSLSPPAAYPINTTLSGSAAGNYTVNSTSGTVTVTQAPTLGVVATTAAASPGVGTAISITDTVTSTVNAASIPAGNVNFYDGGTSGTLLGTRALGTAGVATLSISTLALGTHTITAVYVGNADFAGDTSSNTLIITVVNPGFTFALTTAPSITVQQGQTGTANFTVTAVGGLTSTITSACSGLPANATCTFTPPTFTPTTTAVTQNGLLVVSTGGQAMAQNRPGYRPQPEIPLLAAIFGGGLFFFRRKRKLDLKLFLLLCGITAALLGAGGCGSGSTPLPAVVTPVGASTVTITAQSGTISQTTTFTLTVTSSQ